ncbi:nicotinate phosphoribosyltransferase [Candidatus Kaiserbacteria bacterium]|nr:nicotinate phosphoribosyltransferase [Candidatus Kaiserbacteria bacterium]
MRKRGFIRKSDSYHMTQWKMIPPGTEHMHSFFESRGGRFPATTFFGLQYTLKEHFVGQVVTEEDIEISDEKFAKHFKRRDVFNRAGWTYILKEYGGRVPLRIKAVLEGTTVPTHNVLFTVENTDRRVPWLTDHAETILSHPWDPMTTATNSLNARATILKYLEETGTPELIEHKLVDFGYRGECCDEAAGIGGAGVLLATRATDNWAALELIDDYYGGDVEGDSIPASQHSIMTCRGLDGEGDAVEQILDAYPDGLVSIVGDSYDIYAFCRDILGKRFKMKIMVRDGVVIVRPDSGYPVKMVLEVLNILGEAFGFSVNEKGYRVLDPHVRVLQGDGIDLEMIEKILAAMKENGWSTDNIIFGSGGGLLRKFDRDTQKCKIACSAICINGVWRNVIKNPITDPGKRSKAGRLQLMHDSDGYKTVREGTGKGADQLVQIFENGDLIVDQMFSEIKARAHAA